MQKINYKSTYDNICKRLFNGRDPFIKITDSSLEDIARNAYILGIDNKEYTYKKCMERYTKDMSIFHACIFNAIMKEMFKAGTNLNVSAQ